MEQTVAEGAVVQLGSPVQGDRALVTDGRGGSADTYDVDGDVAIESPEITLPSDVESISMDFSWYFNHSSAATRGDLFMVEVEETGASVRRVAMTELGSNQVRSQGWQQETLNLTNLKGRTVRITLTARDMGSDATIEAGFDNLRITAVARTIDDVPTGAADIVTLAGRTDGWVRVGSTRNWVSAGCRSQLDAAGMDLKIVSWPTLAALSDAVPFDGCSQLLATHAGAPGAAGPDIVTLAGRADGWVRVDGTRNWVGAACRPLLLDEGLSLNVVSWPTLAELTDAVPFENCDQLLAVYSDAVPINDEQPDLVTLAGRTDGWVRVDGTRNWVGAACRPQLMAAGLELSVVSWATLAELPDAVPFENCDQLIAGLSG